MQPWYPFYWADYSGKTLDLTQGQHGAYNLLLRYIYTTGKRIAHQRRYSIAKATSEQEQQNVDFVLTEFFKRKSDEWYNEKADEVISDADRRHEAYVNAGKASAKRRYNKAPTDVGETLQRRSTNYNHNQKEKGGTSPRAPSGAAPSPPVKIDPSWNGSQAKLVEAIGEGAFNAYFAQTQFDTGPPARIQVAKQYQRDLIERKHGAALKRVFGEVLVDVSRPHSQQEERT